MGSPKGSVPVHGFTHVNVKLSANVRAGQFTEITHFQVFLLPNNARGVRLQLMLHFLWSWKSANVLPVHAVTQ